MVASYVPVVGITLLTPEPEGFLHMSIMIENGRHQLMVVVPERLLPHYLPMVRALTEDEGFGTVVQSRAKDALWHLAADHLPLPHAILVVEYDHGFDGAALIGAIRNRAHTRHLPIVALSSDCDPCIPERGPRALRHGASEFHRVPIDTATLAGRIRDLITAA